MAQCTYPALAHLPVYDNSECRDPLWLFYNTLGAFRVTDLPVHVQLKILSFCGLPRFDMEQIMIENMQLNTDFARRFANRHGDTGWTLDTKHNDYSEIAMFCDLHAHSYDYSESQNWGRELRRRYTTPVFEEYATQVPEFDYEQHLYNEAWEEQMRQGFGGDYTPLDDVNYIEENL